VMDGAAAEHVREGIPVLASYCDALGIRAFAEGKDLPNDLAETAFHAMASLVDKPLINLESAVNHPCQALADWKTMDDLGVPRSGRFVLSWVYHPRALPLAVPAADCRLMHCLPVRRNTAVADEVLDSPRSAVQREAYNRLSVQMAVLYQLLKGL